MAERPKREPPGANAALELAARFLATRPRSRWEVERRLRRAGTEPQVVASTLERLETLRFVDDAAFARWWLEQRDRHAPRGRRMIEAELRQHGVGREVIAELREELAQLAVEPEREPTGEALPRSEDERARAALARHLRGRTIPEDRRARERIGMYLVRRGFDPETARRAIREATTSEETPETEG